MNLMRKVLDFFKNLIKKNDIFIISTLAVLTLISGWVGFENYLNNSKSTHNIWDSLYRSVQLFNLNSGGVDGEVSWPLQIARWLAPIIVVYAGIKAFLVIAKEQIKSMELIFYKRHTVICGLGKKGKYLAEEFIKDKKKVVIIELNGDNKNINNLEDNGAIILKGDAADKNMLNKAKINQAENLYILTGDDEINIDIGRKAKEIVKDNEQTLKCYIHIFDSKIMQLLKEHNLFEEANKSFYVRIFNTTLISSKLALKDYIGKTFYKKNDTNKIPHILLVGFGWQGQSLLLELAHYFHMSNKNLLVTIIDIDNKKLEKFLNKYPFIDKFIDIDKPIISKDIELFNANEYNERNDVNPFDEIYICLGDEKLALSISMRLREITNNKIPIIVFMTQTTGIGDIINEINNLKDKPVEVTSGTRQNIKSFKEKNMFFINIIEDTSKYLSLNESKIEDIAIAIHKNYLKEEEKKLAEKKEELKKINAEKAEKSIIDNITKEIKDIESNPIRKLEWTALTEEYKESNRNQAIDIFFKLKIKGYSDNKEDFIKKGLKYIEIKNDEFYEKDKFEYLAQIEHRRWMVEKYVNGWKNGEGQDYKDKKEAIEKKINPCLTDWEKLSKDDKEKDINSIIMIPEVFNIAGKKIYKEV